MRIVCIVEGHGEVLAVPILLRNLVAWRTTSQPIEIPLPIRVQRNRFLNKPDEFSRYLRLANQKCGQDGWILILLDADDDCPAALAADILVRAQSIIPDRNRLSVVMANREFEAWYIGAARSLDGYRGLTLADGDLLINAELPRDAKGWLSQRLASRRYGETTDQPAFAARMDPAEAYARCRSFRKLCSEWDRQTQTTTPPPSPNF